MVLGLGTGSTVAFVVAEIRTLLFAGKLIGIIGMLPSTRTFEQVKSLAIPLSTLDDLPKIDLVIDGTDEVENLRKKGGVVEICECDDVDVYVKVVAMMYCGDLRRRLAGRRSPGCLRCSSQLMKKVDWVMQKLAT